MMAFLYQRSSITGSRAVVESGGTRCPPLMQRRVHRRRAARASSAWSLGSSEASETLDLLAADDQFVLREALLKTVRRGPPLPIECVRHHFVHDDVVSLGWTGRVLPDALCRSARIGGESAESLSQLLSHGGVMLRRKGSARIVIQWQKELDEVNIAAFYF